MYVGIDFENMLRRQMVLPLDFDGPALKSLDRRTGVLPFISPQYRRRKLRMHLSSEFQHANAILNQVLARALRHQSLGNWEGIQISLERARRPVYRLSNRRALTFVSIEAIRKNQSW